MNAKTISTQDHPFLDPELSLGERIDDLVSRLTLLEKVNQLMHENNAVDRIGVPAYNWWNEACHGVGRNGRATVFPQVIGLAATWNSALVGDIARIISDEARAKHHAAVAAGKRGQFQGLTFWTPNINIFRDPRWGRGQETFGEDPFLTGELALAMVHGLQGDDRDRLKVAACAKHFAVHSGPEDQRHGFDARPTEKDLFETYLPAFEKLVRGGVEAVMGAYNRVNGEAACASRRLLVDILRGAWGFRGHVVSDCGAIDDIFQHHGVANDAAAAAALAVRMGCDLNCGCTYHELVAAVCDGLITGAEIDTALRRLLATKFRLGLFDPPEHVAYASVDPRIIDCEAHRAVARRAAVESMVLLKNANGVLPLPDNPASILVVGPTAANVGALLGNYYGVSSRLVTIAEGIVGRVDEGTRVKYRPGCPLVMPGAPGVNYTFGAAASSDIVIAVMGLDPTLEGEEGDTVASPTGGDRQAIELPENQRMFLRELRKHSKVLVLVLTGGSALAVPEEHEMCDAVLQVWYPGCEGGAAVAQVLFGDAAPSGRMPVTVPMGTKDLPAFDDYHMAGRTYRFAEAEPLYPFGFGLGYEPVNYERIVLDRQSAGPGEVVRVVARVRNAGLRESQETIQCYVIPPQDWPDAPRASLVGFAKTWIPAGECIEHVFELDEGAFSQFDASGKRVRVPGRYSIVVGPCSPGTRGPALGAPASVRAGITLTT